MNVEEAVEILTTQRTSRYRFEREFAVATFCGWVNSPATPADLTATMFAAFNWAVLHAREASFEPPSDWLTEVYDAASYLNPATALANEPMCWLLSEQSTYSDCRYAADIVRFMLTFHPKSPDKRKQASLGKAWEFINKHGGYNKGKFDCDRKDWCSISRHSVIWRHFKRSAPFQCARFHGVKFNWYLDPRKSDFLEQLISTAARVDDIINYFGQVVDIQERLRMAIDKRSMAPSDYFLIPAAVERRQCRLPAMSGNAYGKMDTYRRSSSLSTPDWS